MIKLTIFGFLLVCAVDAWFPEYNWLSIPVFCGCGADMVSS